MLIIAKKFNKKGSAMLLTMFILASMLIVAMSGAYLISIGIVAGNIQSESIKAYFAAEAGTERLLWELRQNGFSYGTPGGSEIFTGTLSETNATYSVYFSDFPPLVFTSIGEYQRAKRSVEVRI